MIGTCNTCKKASTELKRCAKCSTTLYCSRDCQKADWKAHKKICSKQTQANSGDAPSSSSGFGNASSAATALSPPKGLEQPITKPFTRLDNGTYLHDRPEIDVYRILIDSYRMRVEDEYVFEGNVSNDSLYGGAPHGLRGFEKYLRSATRRQGLLPPWWNAEKKEACKSLGMDSSSSHYLGHAVEKSDINEHYGDPRFAMQLRMLAEAVIGRGFAGNDATQMRRIMASMESDRTDGMVATMATIDQTTGTFSTVHS